MFLGSRINSQLHREKHLWLCQNSLFMATKKYKQIFALSVKLILNFARVGRQPTLEDIQKHLQAQGIPAIRLENELWILDDSDEPISKFHDIAVAALKSKSCEALSSAAKTKL